MQRVDEKETLYSHGRLASDLTVHVEGAGWQRLAEPIVGSVPVARTKNNKRVCISSMKEALLRPYAMVSAVML